MIKLQGLNGEAKVFTDLIEDAAKEQVKEMLDNPISEKAQVRIMPDVHAGKGSTVGTTIKLPENFEDWKVSPNIVGIDVGCGILMYKIKPHKYSKNGNIDLASLDFVVNTLVPSGFNVHSNAKDRKFTQEIIDSLTLKFGIKNQEHIHNSLGTLGGGNHFIELGVDEDGEYWLSVHSGSRYLGLKVATAHQKIAEKKMNSFNVEKIVNELKSQGRHKEIQEVIKSIKEEKQKIEKDKEFALKDEKEKVLAYLSGEDIENYLNDMIAAQKYAARSREVILDTIVKALALEVVDKFDSVHNFIEHDNFKNGTIRKGATSAKEGERLVIPLNMRDGSIIAVGKGNKDWNESAPHGAGRMLSRSQARKKLKLEDFKEQMSDVYTTSVMQSTINEAPDAYKPAQSIIDNIKDTADIIHIVKPIYNFKAHD